MATIASLSTQADDLDVYTASIGSSPKPNILFVLDYSTSMTWDISGRSWSYNNGPSRISVLKSAMDQLLDNNAEKINAGLGSLYSTTTTGIRWPISSLTADANTIDPDIPANTLSVKDMIKQRINEREANGATATVDALVEAAQYFRGDPVTHNDSSSGLANRHKPPVWNIAQSAYANGHPNASLAATYSPSNAYSTERSGNFLCNDYSESGGPDYCAGLRASNCTSISANNEKTEGYERLNNLWGDYKRCQYRRYRRWQTPRYNSPLTGICDDQLNAIVLITDGEPTAIKKGASLRNLIPGGRFNNCRDLSSVFANSVWTNDEGNCAIEIVESLATQTVIPALPDSRVQTYTVGFNINGDGQDFLDMLATAGGGQSYSASDPDELQAALTDIISKTTGGSENFAQLSVDVDRASFGHDDRVYYSLFSPSKRRSWQGNLKGYFVESDGLVGINGIAATQGNVFNPDTQSFWSAEPDGDQMAQGGASHKLLSAARKLYTYVGNDFSNGPVTLAGPDTTHLIASNSSITNAMLGLDNDEEGNTLRNTALDWIQNAPMGAPLHTTSVGVNYPDRQIRYIMTNQGLLHAFDATNPSSKAVGDAAPDTRGGDEVFAFMPKRLLKNLPQLSMESSGEEHIYGLDGSLTRWHEDTNNDGIVNNGEAATLYFGMRRGGSAYYAMDVSDPESPKLKWVIDESNPRFSRLAQSWSRMSIIRVAFGNTTKKVLAFAGGYDAAAQDDVNGPVASNGNAIYMIDEDGNYLWSVDNQNNEHMKYSIASDLTLIDSNNDGLADRLYVGDLGGQVWRVDFGNIVDDAAIVTRLANLADNYHQPFFYPPSVALSGKPGKRFLSVVIGSGNRTDPLLTGVRNGFYMIRDKNVSKGAPQTPPATVIVNDLYDATDNAILSTDTQTAKAAKNALDASLGWRITLNEGEKSLSKILTFENKIMATTYESAGNNNVNECGVEPTSRFYVMNVEDASPVDGLFEATTPGSDGQSDTTYFTRSRQLDTPRLSSGPTPVLTSDSSEGLIVIDREIGATFDRTLSQVYWHAK